MITEKGSLLEGTWKNGKKHGFFNSTLSENRGKYKGEFREDKKHGTWHLDSI